MFHNSHAKGGLQKKDPMKRPVKREDARELGVLWHYYEKVI